MKKFLKFIVVFLGVMIILLLSITILAIFNKYKNQEVKIVNSLELNPKLEEHYSIKNFHIEKNQIFFHLESEGKDIQLIRSYNIKNGSLISEIILK